jgi:hypothetical protein
MERWKVDACGDDGDGAAFEVASASVSMVTGVSPVVELLNVAKGRLASTVPGESGRSSAACCWACAAERGNEVRRIAEKRDRKCDLKRPTESLNNGRTSELGESFFGIS